MRKKKVYISLTIVFLITTMIGINKYNPYLRTDLFRSFAKGNWYITSEKDTLYTMGYYGARKYLATNPKKLKLIAENDKFCTERSMGRGGCIDDKYLYVTVRSFLPGPINNGKNGKLAILRKSDLSIVKVLEYDIKLVEAKIHRKILVVSGLGGFDIYNCLNYNILSLCFSYRHPKYREYQGFDFIERNKKVYVVFALFGEGLEIWNITHPKRAQPVCLIPINKQMTVKKEILKGQCMDIATKYPYIYATFGPLSETFRTEQDKRGILVYDISNINNIKESTVLIPAIDWYNKKTGDRQPTYISLYKNHLYVNFGEKGVAVFDINNPAKPYYKGTIDISGENALIQPIHATNQGILFTGSYYWPTIYGSKIE